MSPCILFAVALLVRVASGAEASAERALASAAAAQGRALAEIHRTLKAIQPHNKEQQAALDQLIQQSATAERLDTTQIQLLQNISDLLDSILLSMRAERDTTQDELDEILGKLDICNDSGMVQWAILQAEVESNRTTHDTCRSNEEILFDDDNAKCTALTQYLTQLNAPACVLPTVELTALPTWTSFLDTGYNWFNTTLTSYIPLRNDCVNSTATLQAAIQECNQDQLTYEGHFCEFHEHVQTTCANLVTCYDQEVAAHNTLVQQVIPVANLRVREANLITHVLCLIENLVDGLTDHTLCPTEAVNAQEYYNQTYPVIPAMRNCDTSYVDVYPGSVGWLAYAYNHLSAKTPPLEDTGVVCATI